MRPQNAKNNLRADLLAMLSSKCYTMESDFLTGAAGTGGRVGEQKPMDKLKNYLAILPEVQKALEQNRPVVTVESADLLLSLPYPQNAQAMRQVAEILRRHHAVPAFIAVAGGRLRIGLTDEELDGLARRSGTLRRGSRRDLAILLARGEDGATSVAAGMILSCLAGARVFLTASVGGVHHGASFGQSADLEELGRTSILVVCSGVSPALDVAATVENLATRGVPVVGYGTNEMPALYAPGSGCPLVNRVDSPAEAARVFLINECIGLPGGVLVANPIPAQDAPAPALIEDALRRGDEAARLRQATGKDRSVLLNDTLAAFAPGALTALMCENARLAAQIACEVHLLG